MSTTPSTEWLATQHFPAGSEPAFVYVWVQATNHDWVAEFTGLPVDEIAKRYEQSVKDGLILSIKLRWTDVKEKHQL